MINIENWTRYIPNESMPIQGERCLVSDGEFVVIARYIKNNDEIVWIFDEESHKDIKIDWFQYLPDEPPKIISGSAENVLTT